MKLEPGVYRLTRAEYEPVEGVNFSTLKWIERSPFHYRARLTESDQDTPARQRGRAVSAAVFEPERYASEFVVYPKRRDSKEWERFEAANQGKEILTTTTSEAVDAIAKVVRTHKMAAPFLARSEGEVTIVWDHVVEVLNGVPGYTIRCKGRVDSLGAWLCDLKNSKNASPAGFPNEAARYLTHVQAPWYSDGVLAATGKRRPFALIVVEPEPPYALQVYTVPERVLEKGRSIYRTWLDRLNVCLQTGEYPCYAEAPLELELPRWLDPVDEDDVDEALLMPAIGFPKELINGRQ